MAKGIKRWFIISVIAFLLAIGSLIPIKAEDEKDIKINELQTQLKLYDEALNELQALTPEETALVYAKGVKNRNGIMQYSVLSQRLKEVFKKEMWNEHWVTGVSSPWVADYEIVSNKKAIIAYKVTVKFNWATSTGSAGSTQEQLTIAKEDGKWRIVNIKPID